MRAGERAWAAIVQGLLACYPRLWRDRFGEQVQADLEEARSECFDRAGLVLWMLATMWDLVRGSIPAHVAAMKERRAVLAVAGGGPSDQKEPVDYMRAWGFVARQMPTWVFFGGLTILGAALMGMWVYDMAMFLGYGFIGLALVGTAGRLMYTKTQASILAARQAQNPTEELAWRLGLVALALTVALLYLSLFEWMSNYSMAAAKQLPPAPMVGVASMPVVLLVWLTGYALVMTMAGLWSRPSTHPLRRPLIALALLVVVGVGGGFAVHTGALSALGATILALPLVGLAVGAWKNVRWVNLCGMAAGMLSLPILIGFLAAMILDISKTQEQMNEMFGVNASAPTLFDQAQAHHQALNQVRSGDSEGVFWDYLESAKTSRQEWERAKPWTRLYHPEPLGVSALTWCVAASTKAPELTVKDCAALPDHHRILEGPPQE